MSSAALSHGAPSPPAGTRDAEVIGLVGLAHGTSHFFHLLLPPLFPWLMPQFGLSFTQAGFLMTVFFVISGIGQALAGFVVDRIGARPVLLFGVAMLALSGVVLGLAQSYGGLIAAAAVAGVGNSIFHPADFTLLNRRVSTPRLGHAFSVHGLSGNLGWAAAPVFMAGIASMSDWHVAAFAAAGIGGAVLVLLLVLRDSLNDVERVVVPSAAALASTTAATAMPTAAPTAMPNATLAFLRSPAVWICFLFFFLATGAFGILQSYAPAILGNVYGLPLAWATGGLTAYLLGSAAGMVTGGFVAARRTDSDRVIALALGGAAVMAVLLASGGLSAWLVLPVMAMMGFGVGVAGPNRDLLVRRAATAQFGKASYGRVYGFVYSGLDLGLALSPIVFGPLLDAGRFHVAMFGVAALQVLALLTALRVGRDARVVAPVGGRA
ncbi:MAG: MFS transporter [Burkholderiaceae bacterium]|jgi:MFS family permease|nr:MFS transporter [Burkholderiaceae bacterium]